MRGSFLAVAILALVLPGIARAGLKWDQTTIEVRAGPNDQMAIAHFLYQNTGATPVRFKSVKPACGCTTVQTQQEEVPAGEKGEITARLNIGDRTGLQEKTITVDTDDPTNPTTILTIKAVIPEVLVVSPTFLFWQSNESPKPKMITVKVAKDWSAPVRNLKVNSSNWDFAADVERVDKNEFRVAVHPRDTSRSSSATLTIEPEDSTRKYVTNLRVMGSAPAASLLSNPSSQSNDDLLQNPFNEPPSGPPPGPPQ